MPQQLHRRHPDSKQSQINFKLAAHPPSSPCCEEELAILFAQMVRQPKRKKLYFD